MKKWIALAVVLAVAGCKKEEPAKAAGGKLAGQLVGKWNDADDGSLAWEFSAGGKCKAFGEMDCSWESVSESGSLLKLRYKAVDSWDDVEVSFDGTDKATWKDLTEAKDDPDFSVTKMVRAK